MRRPSGARLLLALMGLLFGPRTMIAQERGILAITTRSVTGEPISFARLTARGGRKDTTVRAADNGISQFVLPFGTYHLTATMIGYAPYERDVIMNEPDLRIEITLDRLVQNLSAVDVVGNWIGIRGVVGDSALTGTLADAGVHVPNGQMMTTTDSVGRFAIRLDRAEPTVLKVDRKGYRTHTTLVDVAPRNNPDIVVLLRKGKSSNTAARQQFDLSYRMRQIGTRGLIMSRAELQSTGKIDVEDALWNSDQVLKHALTFGRAICVFENGKPQYGVRLSSYKISSIDFVEVWAAGADKSGTLMQEWMRGVGGCGTTKRGSEFGTLRFVGVWLRQQ